ncbi:replication protein, partial [Xanthomonas citri pv. citri]|nr:replication protein [Xanthomonas citri pv. citri]
MATNAQLALFSIDDEARTYHDAGRTGFFSLLVAHGDDKRQSSHKLIHMPTVLGLIDTGRDTWMTQAEFLRPNRRVVNLL